MELEYNIEVLISIVMKILWLNVLSCNYVVTVHVGACVW